MPTLDVIAIISIIVVGVVLVVELFVVTALLLVVKNLVAEVREHIDPLMTKANSLLTTANQMAETVQDRTEQLAVHAAQATDSVGSRVDTTSRLVQRIVATPIIQGMAAVTGLRRGLAIWRTRRRARREPTP